MPTYVQPCPTQESWLLILGSDSPEIQDQRTSTRYLLWIDGKARVLIDVGGELALQFDQSSA